MLLAAHSRIRYLRPFHERGVVHLAQIKTAFQQADDVLVDLGFCHQSTTDGLGNAAVSIAITTLYVSTGDGSLGRSVDGIGGRLMRFIEIADGTTVADDQILEAPLITQNLLQQSLTATAGIIVQALVGAHHLTDLGILYQCLEGRHIGFPEVAGRNVGQVGRVAGVLRTTMNGVVLGTSPELAVLGILGALKSTNHLNAHDTGQVGVFTVGLLSPAPSRITENVHIRRPNGEAVELLVLTTVQHTMVVLRTELRTGSIEHLI